MGKSGSNRSPEISCVYSGVVRQSRHVLPRCKYRPRVHNDHRLLDYNIATTWTNISTYKLSRMGAGMDEPVIALVGSLATKGSTRLFHPN